MQEPFQIRPYRPHDQETVIALWDPVVSLGKRLEIDS